MPANLGNHCRGLTHHRLGRSSETGGDGVASALSRTPAGPRESFFIHSATSRADLMRCPICVAENPEAARFCNACGAPLGGASSERLRMLRSLIPNEVAQKIMTAEGIGERRIVTVLFCDVVGSTGLGERLGPERFKVVMDQVLGRIVTAVSCYEGTVAH